MDRWEPVPVPQGDGRHDIGDDVRAAIVHRLMDDWSRDPDLTPKKARELAMWAGASVRALLHELGTLRDLASEDELMPEAEALMLAPEPWMRRKLFRCRVCGATSETATYHVECQHGLSEIETWFAGDGKTES